MPIFERGRDVKIDALFTVGAESSNVINVAIQLVDRDNRTEVDERVGLAYYWSDDANGDTPSSTPPTTTAIGTDGGITNSGAVGNVISETDGDLDLDVTEAGTGTWYLNLILPDGKVMTSGAVTFA